MSTLDDTLKPEATAVRRLEVITGTGRRRAFSDDFKAGIVEETLVPGAVVSEVARRNGLTPQQVFTWRRQARRLTASEAEAPQVRAGRCGASVAGAAITRTAAQTAHTRWMGALAASRWRSKASACGSAAARKPRR